MSTLILRSKGPMQSWAVNSRYTTREAGREPSKSGVIGLVAAALGRNRGDAVDDLVDLRMGVRTDQPGRLLVDYHTAKVPGNKHSTLSWRHYLSDAAFTIALGGEDSVIQGIASAVQDPRFPLYLGRRSCPAPIDLFGGVSVESDVEVVLRDLEITPWLASEWHRKQIGKIAYLPLSRDARPGENGELVRDVPQSFDPRNRIYDSRSVARLEPIVVENADGVEESDPFFDLVKEG